MDGKRHPRAPLEAEVVDVVAFEAMTPTDSKSELLKLDTLGRARTSREKREEILDAFEASGISGASFAKSHGIRYTTFANWVQRRRKLKAEAQGVPGFAQVVVRAENAPRAALRIALPGGANVHLHTPEDAVIAAVLLREIAGGSAGC